MVRYVIKRLISVIPVVLGVMLIVFFFQSVSGDDPVDQLLGAGATEEQREAMRDELGLNDLIVVQFGRYVWNFVTTGSLGTSYKSGQPVTQELMARYPVTIRLALLSVALGTIIGIPLGVISSVKQYTAADSIIISCSVLTQSMPSFWLALLLVSLFSVRLGWLPVSGINDVRGWILPIIVVTFGSMSMIIQVTRAAMLETIRQDFIRNPETKEWKIWHFHWFRLSRNDYDKSFTGFAKYIQDNPEPMRPKEADFEVLPTVFHYDGTGTFFRNGNVSAMLSHCTRSKMHTQIQGGDVCRCFRKGGIVRCVDRITGTRHEPETNQDCSRI